MQHLGQPKEKKMLPRLVSGFMESSISLPFLVAFECFFFLIPKVGFMQSNPNNGRTLNANDS